MAFDHPDTDAVFTAIETTLKPMRIKAIRVDRVEHNDDIDDRIISEIKDADFVIADLTYARPSVYFEAGLAHCRIPVIYTVRSDHFKHQANDINGNLRVHFDLQMKNMIAWAEPNDIFFKKQLRSRVSKVIAPLLRQRAVAQDAKVKVARFTDKSQQEQREYLKESARSHFRHLSFQTLEVSDHGTKGIHFLCLDDTFRGAIVCVKRENTVLKVIFIHVVQSITKRLCQHYSYNLIEVLPYDIEATTDPGGEPAKVEEEIIVCSFGSSGLSRMAKEIPKLRRRLDGVLSFSDMHKHYRDGLSFNRQVHIHVIESASKLADFDGELKRTFV